MGLSHTEPAYTDKAAPFIEEFGGKLGGLEFLRATDSELAKHILETTIIKPDAPAKGIIPRQSHSILRASHPHDFQGLVNVIDSVPYNILETREEMATIVETIRRRACSEEVLKYAKYENPAYDGNVVVGIQPLINDDVLHRNDYRRGSVVEHPNRPETYLVEWIDEWEVLNTQQRVLLSALYNQRGKLVENFLDHEPVPTDTSALVHLYDQIRRSKLVRDDCSFQMEFGSTPVLPVLIYQVRAFMKRTIPDFHIDPREANANVVFGSTTENGTTLPVVIQSNGSPACPTDPVAILTPRPTDHRNLNFQPQNVGVYLAGQTHGRSPRPNLQHGNFWRAQKADVTVFEPYNMQNDFATLAQVNVDKSLQELPEGMQDWKIHIIADGRNAIVRRVD
ncbi:hypothetical protein A3C37_00815 [Candidatus Peribacteria bacterium RIFCSPHIGHO2_02_FULL_53_20]|nr:MAG: hypothetical protein A3C37_00815 [Candidatus Peribacteria bacterium RIFCSPHIGHO2_02_FULL_53_20]OGJ66539.1 MAG: hypothetical protein A3B61_04065 [Candidatus Peribacteria bacterium RIFCSPLOWO2_01_FULL_53_10]OGJ69526.1 MAG: hypothetical protein A3G69_02290 [Candidatus Peribacteria bacterium RIFCSPLOWO2_12_FULL_53_10]